MRLFSGRPTRSTAISTDHQKLLLTELEVEVVYAALELYLQTRSLPSDGRFEYRYRAARSVLGSLRQENNGLGTFPVGDDEKVTRRDDERPERRSPRERIED